ncbi:MAG: hypothetical protein JXE07_06790 [Candidatus Aminicenantes bacterium]|nr:hypothetical protein [Candidatus Aminicenantes bacterium]
MKNHLAMTLLGLAFLTAVVPNPGRAEEDAEALIDRARIILRDPQLPRETITEALVAALDASLLILPEADYSEEFRTRIGTVREMFGEQVLFSDKGRQYLGLAYRTVSGGKRWEIPEELKDVYDNRGIEKAREICSRLLDSALAEWKAGRNERAVSLLLDFVILVVTPIEA